VLIAKWPKIFRVPKMEYDRMHRNGKCYLLCMQHPPCKNNDHKLNSKKWSPVSLNDYISASSKEKISFNVNIFYFQTYIDMECEESVNTSKDSSTLNITSIISNLVRKFTTFICVNLHISNKKIINLSAVHATPTLQK
jgi:hypothetical protein